MNNQICPWQLDSDSFVQLTPYWGTTSQTDHKLKVGSVATTPKVNISRKVRPKSSVPRARSAHPRQIRATIKTCKQQLEEEFLKLDSESMPLGVRRESEIIKRTLPQTRFEVSTKLKPHKKSNSYTVFSSYKNFSKVCKKKQPTTQQIVSRQAKATKMEKKPNIGDEDIFINKKLMTMIKAVRGKRHEPILAYSSVTNTPKKVGFVYYNNMVLEGKKI